MINGINIEEVDMMVDYRYLYSKEEFRHRGNAQSMGVGGVGQG